MKNTIQNTIIGIFALVGLFTIISGFNKNNTTQQNTNYSVPESHVWEIVSSFETTGQQRVYTLNKVTGEVRKYSKAGMNNGKLKDQYYQVLTENKEGEK